VVAAPSASIFASQIGATRRPLEKEHLFLISCKSKQRNAKTK
jgi:hypothetical protein